MADTSSDDEVPLAQRPFVGFNLGAPAARLDSSDSDSDIPSWLQTGAGGQKCNQVITLTDDDSDDAVLSPPKPAAPAAEPAGNRDVQQPATQQLTDSKAAAVKPAAAPRSSAKQKATPRGRGRAAAAGASTAGDGAPEEAPATQPATQPPQTQPSQPPTAGTAQKRIVPAVGLAHAPASSMPVVLPEKLPQMKMLVELECNPDDAHGVTDLSGDSGAIGRLLMGGTKAEPQMQIDLKGVLYNATIVPCPVSLAVINMGHTEAKVECLFSEFVQLREDTRFSFVDTDLGGMVAGEDDDDCYAGAAGGEERAEGGDGAGAKKGRAKAAAGKAGAGAKAAPRKRAVPRAKGGVKKGPGKPRAKPKPKAAAKKK